MAFRMIWQQRRVTILYSGPVSDVQAAMAARLIQGEPRCDDIHEILHDGRACTSFTFSETVTEEIAAIDGAFAMSNKHLRIAVVSGDSDVIAAVRFYESLKLSPLPIRVFADPEAADSWLRA